MIRAKRILFIVVIIQGLHSTEEYIGQIWTTFPPAQWLCSLISDNLESGFLVINISLFVVGLLCVLSFDIISLNSKKTVIYAWIVLEMINGIGHIAWSLSSLAYQPGLFTAPLLLIFSLFLFRKTRAL